jgi:undecaprenol kinase
MVVDLLKSLFVAIRGTGEALLIERNFRLMWLAALLSSLLIYLLPFPLWAQMLLLCIIFGILSLELFNSSVEKVCDSFGRDYNELKRQAKDFGASSVLMASILSLLVFFSILATMPKSAFSPFFNDPMLLISLIWIFMGNIPLCLLPRLSPYAIMLLIPNLIIHVLFLVASTGDPLFLGLSIVFHLGLASASLIRSLAKS